MNKKIKIPFFKIPLFLFCLLQLNGYAIADETPSIDTESLYLSALKHYEDKNYIESIKQLEIAVAEKPEVAKYNHILAVSYGREAQNVNWFKAMDYAKKTLKYLEIARKLDPKNLEILDDLMDFYHEAPGFLGGDTKKGDEIEALIEKLTLKNQENSNN